VWYWKRHLASGLCGDEEKYTSRVRCSDSSNLARFCEFDNALLDMSKVHNVKRPGRSDSRRYASLLPPSYFIFVCLSNMSCCRWDPGFLSTHCDVEIKDINYYDVRNLSMLHILVS